MAVTTVPLQPIYLMLRKPFVQRTQKDKSPIANDHGEAQFMAEAAAPGQVRFGPGEDFASEVRLRVDGVMPTMPENSIVEVLGGQVTTWYRRGERGSKTTSGVTIKADTVRLAPPGTVPAYRGGLPAHNDGVGVTILGATYDAQDRMRGIDVMFDAVGLFAVSGITELRCETPFDDSLIGKRVAVHDLRVWFTRPDPDDVNQRSKAEMMLSCSHVSSLPAETSNGRRPKDVQPDPEPAPVG